MTADITIRISPSVNKASDAAPSSSVPTNNVKWGGASRSSDFCSKPSPKGGPRIKSLFPDPATTEQEKQRLLNYLHAHNLGSNDFDSSEQNTMNRIVVCFFREWSKRNMLTPKVGATHLVRFLKSDCGLSLSVEEKALANHLSNMINSQQFDPDWGGDVSAYLQM